MASLRFVPAMRFAELSVLVIQDTHAGLSIVFLSVVSAIRHRPDGLPSDSKLRQVRLQPGHMLELTVEYPWQPLTSL